MGAGPPVVPPLRRGDGVSLTPRPPLQHLERGWRARIGALNVGLDCGLRRNDGGLGTACRAPTGGRPGGGMPVGGGMMGREGVMPGTVRGAPAILISEESCDRLIAWVASAGGEE